MTVFAFNKNIQRNSGLPFVDGGTATVSGMTATDVRDSSHRSGGWLSKRTVKEHTETAVLQAAALKVDRAVKFSARTLKGQLDEVRIQAETLLNQAQQGLVAAPLVGLSSQVVESSQSSLLSGSKAKQNIGQEVMVATTLDVDKIITLGAKLKLISTALPEGMIVDDVYETAKRELTSWNIVESKTTGIPAPVLQLAAIALAIYSGGAAAQSLYGALSGAAGTSAYTGAIATLKLVGTQLGTTLLANGGDMETALKSTFSQQGFLSMTTQVVSAGVLDKMGVVAPKPGAPLPQLVDYGARRAAVNAGINVAFGRESASEAFRGAGVNFLTDVIGQVGANKIGALYNNNDNGQIDSVTHKLAHAGLGAGLGALKGDIAAGAIGGFVSELVADVTKDDVQEIAAKVVEKATAEGINRHSPEFQALIQTELQATMNWGKVASVVTAALAKRDINIALDTATNALENNFIPGVAAAVALAVEFSAFYGVTSLAASVIEDICHTYQQDGADAAMTKLVHQGVAIAAVDGGFKIAGAYFPTAKLAWAAYVEASPKLANIMKNGGELLKRGKVSSSSSASSSVASSSSSVISTSSSLVENAVVASSSAQVVLNINKQITKSNIFLKFKKDSAELHFDKHASELQQAFGKSSYNLREYMLDANHTINFGTYVPELNGYVKLIGGTGSSKAAFVGIGTSENIITTFHIKSVSEIAKKAPSLGWKK